MEKQANVAADVKKMNPKKKIIILVCVVVALAAAVLAAKLIYDHIEAERETARQAIINSGTFHEGITVGGVDVSGMTKDEATAALGDAEAALTADAGFTLTDGEHTYEVPMDLFKITYDTSDKLDEAMALGRDGTLDELEAELEDIKTAGRSFDITYEIEPLDITGFVSGIAAELDVPAVDATFSIKQLETNDETEALNAVNIGLAEDGTTTDIRDLRFDFVEGVEGQCIDQEAIINELTERTASRNYGEISFELEPLYPTTTIATIKESLVLRSVASTSFGKGHYDRASRVFNMTKACGMIYGTVLQPGDVLSCNGILGDRLEKYGWQLAPAVIEGGADTEDQPGGGVCQVSTTMYNAVLTGDFEVVYRQAHSSRLGYVEGGLDATINTRTIDFQWSNNTEAPLYVFTWIDTKNKYIWCEIYGLPFSGDYDEITLYSEHTGDISPTATEYVELSSLYYPYWMLKNESKTGHVYDTYKIYKLNGEEIRRDFIATTTYKMHPTRYYVWPGYAAGTPLQEAYRLYPAE